MAVPRLADLTDNRDCGLSSDLCVDAGPDQPILVIATDSPGSLVDSSLIDTPEWDASTSLWLCWLVSGTVCASFAKLAVTEIGPRDIVSQRASSSNFTTTWFRLPSVNSSDCLRKRISSRCHCSKSACCSIASSRQSSF